MYIDLNGEEKDSLLLFVDMKEWENVTVKRVESEVKLQYTETKQWNYYRGIIEKIL